MPKSNCKATRCQTSPPSERFASLVAITDERKAWIRKLSSADLKCLAESEPIPQLDILRAFRWKRAFQHDADKPAASKARPKAAKQSEAA